MKHPGGSIGSDLSHLNDNFTKLGLNPASSTSSTTTHTESYCSLLSLDKSFNYPSPHERRSENSSLDSSDSEELPEVKPKIDNELSSLIKNASPDQVLSVKQNVISTWTEYELLKNASLYEFITFLTDKASFGLTSEDIRNFYKSLFRSGGLSGMEQLIPIFKMIHL